MLAAKIDLGQKKMCRGWALGSRAFKKSLLEEVLNASDAPAKHFEGLDLKEANELMWKAYEELTTRIRARRFKDAHNLS